MDNTYFYTIPYSVSYMATHSYINGYEYSPERIVLTVNKETGKVSNMFKVGSCLSKGISDYLTYDIANVKGNRVIGSPINECFYIAFIKMLNINNYEELSSLNVETFVNKFNEVGLPNPIKYLIALDFQESNPYYDYTQLFIELLKEYMTIQYENGVSKEEIKAVINDILNTIEERVIITDDEREYIADVNTQAVLSYQDIKNYLYEIYNSKVKKVN